MNHGAFFFAPAKSRMPLPEPTSIEILRINAAVAIIACTRYFIKLYPNNLSEDTYSY
jgi:hypothetical protein